MTIKVTKRDGTTESLDIEKLHKVVSWACEGTFNTSPSEIEQAARIKFYDGIKTAELHESLVSATHDLITKDNQYDLVAGRLAMFDIRKRAYGQFEVPHIYDVVVKNSQNGWYDADLPELFTKEDWDKLNYYIRHDRDFDIRISGVDEWRSKYLVQNRVTKEIKESPQISYMLISAILNKEYGLKEIKDYYNDLSTFTTTLPTPVISGVRTKTKQFSSCVLIECDDSLDSISATADACMKYASRKAGLGVSVSSLRAEKQPVRNGDAYTTGPVPFTQFIEKSALSCSQGSIRKGSINFMHWGFHKDLKKLIVLKNNKGNEETRIRHSDHTFLMTGFLYKKIMKNEQIALFSPEEVPDLYKAFFDNQELFVTLYDKYAKSKNINKEFISGDEFRDLLVGERQSTSRIYTLNVDLANQQGSFIPELAPIRMTNLCVEITLPVKPLQYHDDPDGLIALCTLSAINFGDLRSPKDLEHPCRRAVRALDSLLSYQSYPLKAAKNHTEMYRPLGIGVNNLAYFLAKNNLKYGDQKALELLDEYMEAFSYYLIKASVELAKEKGPCKAYEHTKYAKGIVPVDVRKAAIDEIVPHNPKLDWNELKEDLKKYGIRNATLMACMPSECQSKDNKLLLRSGEVKTLGELLIESGINVAEVEEMRPVGMRFNLPEPIELANSIAYQAYYNGEVDVYEIEFDDGNKYKFTGNHLLKVKTSIGEIWKRVDEINEKDDIVTLF
jgi:ribonucleoside-diphosphate reductase alpha chain